jgi:cation transport regulator ChaC
VSSERYVFGYGSLVSVASVEATLGHPVDPGRCRVASLAGWQRRWNVGSDRRSHPERTFHLPDGTPFDGVTTVLGIAPTDGPHGCCGAVFPVHDDDLRLLDRRERNYRRVPVTDQVTWPGKTRRCVVYTYVPRPEAVALLRQARADRLPVNVRRGYLDVVQQAFASIGLLDAFHASTPAMDCPVTAMTWSVAY